MSRQREIWGAKRARDLDERKAYVKASAHYAEVVGALNLDTDLGDECPACCGFTLNSCADDRGAFCDNPACGETFDMIALVAAKRECGFKAAIEFLEEMCVGCKKDHKTGELFG